MNNDLNKKVMDNAGCPTMFTVKHFDYVKRAKFDEEKAHVFTFLKKYDSLLIGNNDRFTASGETFGEVDLFCKLHVYSQGALPEVTTGNLASFYNRMKELPAIKKVLSGESRYGPLGQYMVP